GRAVGPPSDCSAAPADLAPGGLPGRRAPGRGRGPTPAATNFCCEEPRSACRRGGAHFDAGNTRGHHEELLGARVGEGRREWRSKRGLRDKERHRDCSGAHRRGEWSSKSALLVTHVCLLLSVSRARSTHWALSRSRDHLLCAPYNPARATCVRRRDLPYGWEPPLRPSCEFTMNRPWSWSLAWTIAGGILLKTIC